jgi:hypothetical protein
MKKFVVSAFTALTMMASPAAFAQTATSAQPRAYMIGSYDIKDQAVFQQYIEAASPLVTQYGGRVIVYNRRVPEPCRRPALLQLARIHCCSAVLHWVDRRISHHH